MTLGAMRTRVMVTSSSVRLLLLALLLLEACRTEPGRLEPPTVGTRKTPTGELAARTSAREADIVGCDVEYQGLSSGSKLHITWRYWTDPAGRGTPDATQRADDLEVSGSGVSSAYFEAKIPPLPIGVYECEFAVASDRPVIGREQSARITLGQ